MFSDIRKAAGFTQTELAQKLGIRQNSISAWETGVSLPKSRHLKLLSNILGVDVETILNSLSEVDNGQSTASGN